MKEEAFQKEIAESTLELLMLLYRLQSRQVELTGHPGTLKNQRLINFLDEKITKLSSFLVLKKEDTLLEYAEEELERIKDHCEKESANLSLLKELDMLILLTRSGKVLNAL